MSENLKNKLSETIEIINSESRIHGLERISAEESLVSGTGKLLRPRLLLLSAMMYGCDDSQTHNYAAAVELLHNSTLHHDDIIDSGTVRRGVPTLNVRFDDSFALLAGDFLVAKSFSLAASGGNAEIVSTLSRCYEKLVYGQLREMELDRQIETPEKDYYDVIDNKTASLIQCSLVMGAQGAGVASESLKLMSDIGLYTGRLFQIADDMFDLLGEEDETGKARYKDIREGKMTLPVIWLVSVCTDSEKEFIKECLGDETLTSAQGAEFVALMERTGILKKVHNEYMKTHKEVESMLLSLPRNESSEQFCVLVDKICGRLYKYTEAYE